MIEDKIELMEEIQESELSKLYDRSKFFIRLDIENMA